MGESMFCYLYIEQQAEAWTCLPMFFIGLVLLVFSIARFHKSMSKLNIYIKLTYLAIITSLLFYLIKLVVSQVVFWLQFNSSYDPSNTNTYLNASKYEFIIDCVGIFAMQTAILLVPANWLNNIYQIFSKFSNSNKLNGDEKRQLDQAIGFQKCSIRIVMAYFLVRVISLFCLLIPFVAISNEQALSTVAIITLIWWQVESLLLLIILILGLISVKQNNKLKQVLNDDDYILMIKHYGLLIACTSLRLVTDLLFSLYYLPFLSSHSKCYISKTERGSVFRVSNIILEGLLTLYLSVFIILRIYKDDNAQLQEVQSFIRGESKLPNIQAADIKSNFMEKTG